MSNMEIVPCESSPLTQYHSKILANEENLFRVTWGNFAIKEHDADLNLTNKYNFIHRMILENGNISNMCSYRLTECLHLKVARLIIGERLDDDIVENKHFEVALLVLNASYLIHIVLSNKLQKYLRV